MALAMTDDMKNCNPKPLQALTERSQNGAIQPRPHLDETATIFVAPALASSRNKRINIKIANLTDFPHTIKNFTKVAELQILKPEDTKQRLPIEAIALKLLQDPNVTQMYVNEIQ